MFTFLLFPDHHDRALLADFQSVWIQSVWISVLDSTYSQHSIELISMVYSWFSDAHFSPIFMVCTWFSWLSDADGLLMLLETRIVHG